MIVKIQIPLSTNEKNPLALVYNEDRSFETFIPIGDELLWWMDGEPKAFFNVTLKKVRHETEMKIDSEVEFQDW